VKNHGSCLTDCHLLTQRAGNRQRGNAVLAGINPTAIGGHLEIANIWHTTRVADDSSNQPAPDPALIQVTPELQKFFDEFDTNLAHHMDASEDALFETLNPISSPSTCVGDNTTTRDTCQDYSLNNTPSRQSRLCFTSRVPSSMPSNATQIPNLSSGSMLPDSTFTIADILHHTATSESLPAKSLVAQSDSKLPPTRSFPPPVSYSIHNQYYDSC
jgi:hypothetical protein